MNVSREVLENNGGEYVTKKYRYVIVNGRRIRYARTQGDGLTETGKAQREGRKRAWVSENRERVNLLLPPGYKARIEAEAEGSMTQFIRGAIDKALPMETSGVCPSCGSSPGGTEYCPRCGQKLSWKS